MACRTFKPLPLFMADANNSGSKSHLKQSRNSQAPIQYCLSMIPSNRGVMLFKLSCSTTRICSSPPPSFSLLKEGIPSLAQCLSSSHPVTDDDDKSKVNFEAQEEEEEKDSVRVKFVAEPPLGNALVQVFCEYEGPDLDCPWSTCSGYRRSNGFIIEGRRLLTCAHCIEHHTNVTIRKQDSNTIYQATVIAIAHDFDLAMLTVRDDEFWEGVGSVELGDMPSPRDELTSMSYVEGMNAITSKSGFISDVAMIPFSHGGLELPAFGVIYDSKFEESGSAIINENGKCVGMGFKGTINIHQGWVLPVTIIKHFIQDYDRNGGFTGLPIFGVEWQTMENYDLRMNMMVGDDHEGVLITNIEPHYPEWRVLEIDDIILSIDGVKIPNDGTVPFVRGRRIDLNYLFTQKYTGDNVLVKVLRETIIHEVSIKLATHKQFVPNDVKGRPQSYYIIGGLVFTNLTIPYHQWSNSDSSIEKCHKYFVDRWISNALHGEFVVLAQVLEAEVNKGYSAIDIVKNKVISLNGKPVRGMKCLVSMVKRCRREYLEFILQNQQRVKIRTVIAKEATSEILKTYDIPSAMSDDLKISAKTKKKQG